MNSDCQPTTSNILPRKATEVGIAKGYSTHLPISTSQRRVQSWHDRRNRKTGGNEWVMDIHAVETINYYDFRVLLAIMYYAQENEDKRSENTLAGKPVIDIHIKKSALYKLVGDDNARSFFGYTKKTKMDNAVTTEEPVYGYFQRLSTWTIIHKSADGNSLEEFKPFIAYNREEDIYTVSKRFFDSCMVQDATRLDYQLFCSIESQVAQALYLYLRSNRQIMSKGIKVETIANGIGREYDTRRKQLDFHKDIKHALEHLMKLGILAPTNGFKKAATLIELVTKKNNNGSKKEYHCLKAWRGANFYALNFQGEQLKRLAYNGGAIQ